MLSFEEKKEIFRTFKLEEKEISNGRVNFNYPESKQRGLVLARELQQSGNGYVLGKYMSEEVIRKNNYTVDPRGWISVRDFTKAELITVIVEAMKSMSGLAIEVDAFLQAQGPLKTVRTTPRKKVVSIKAVKDAKRKPVESKIQAPEKETSPKVEEVKKEPFEASKPAAPVKDDDFSKELESYPLSCLFFWTGLTMSLMETGFLMWRNAVRSYGEVRRGITRKE
ncbi:hypothetical protein [Neobacillus rhizophilus]|uniref:Uncharacterized protein n=1 Tax=Neobacillus rhizophilus TaxID=2833579 RepID=A0A942U394_9BACI|nr:hypothetical protein [Neobacillus rhizophilus]MBS4213835.1 hypothetical protein [Neobacillus rhizophilus]MBU8917761.1 hypothetical protein [Bacillus sp. FJAT-29953]